MPVRRVTQRERSKVLDTGDVADVVEISFMVDQDGPFVVDVPKESYTPETVRAMVLDYAQRVVDSREAFN